MEAVEEGLEEGGSEGGDTNTAGRNASAACDEAIYLKLTCQSPWKLRTRQVSESRARDGGRPAHGLQG